MREDKEEKTREREREREGRRDGVSDLRLLGVFCGHIVWVWGKSKIKTALGLHRSLVLGI